MTKHSARCCTKDGDAFRHPALVRAVRWLGVRHLGTLWLGVLVVVVASCVLPDGYMYIPMRPRYATTTGAPGTTPRYQAPVDPYGSRTPDTESPEPEQTGPDSRSGAGGVGAQMRVVYEPAKKPAYEQFRGYLQEGQTFDKLVVALSGMFRFPQELTVVWNECGSVNAYWDGQGRIVMCYELVDYMTGLFAKRLQGQPLRAAVMSTVMFSFLHELGHALIAVFELPAVGREEDAADQLASLMLIRLGGESGVTVAMHGAQFFRLAALSGGKPHFFDEHSLDAQRFYNVLCLVYGSNPQQFGSMVGDDRLPASRARRCPNEYGKIANAWANLLKDHMQ